MGSRTRALLSAVPLAVLLGGATLALSTPAGGQSGGGDRCRVQAANLTSADCRVLRSDTSVRRDASDLWRESACQSASRVGHRRSAGDPHPRSDDRNQEGGVRAVTVLDGDNIYGERCELGRNNRNDTFHVYREGEHKLTFLSLRLRRTFVLGSPHWQVVTQMKQVQPADNGGGTPVLALNAYNGRWQLHQSTSKASSGSTSVLWSTPARKRTWTRFAFDVVYSQDSDRGRVKLYVDRNGDGDALDNGEQSPRFRTYTLKRETSTNAGDGLVNDGVTDGESVPSHLRVGIYHDERIDCPPPNGCAISIDNVQVAAPRR